MPSSGSPSLPESQGTRRNIQRIASACDYCRSRKVRCDGHNPCSGCQRGGQQCVFRDRRQRKPRAAQSLRAGAPQSLNDPVHYKKQLELRAGFGVSNAATGCFQFYGPSSHYCFIQRIYQRINRHTGSNPPPGQEKRTTNGMEKWGLERFMFSVGSNEQPANSTPEAYLSFEMGVTFINSFFEIIHPQMPVLSYEEIMDAWSFMWRLPTRGESKKAEGILYMVLALGARVSHSEGRQDLESSEGWSEHFYGKARKKAEDFEETSLRSTHFLLLKSFYAIQVMKPNDAYIYLGGAARNSLALGINKSQVVDGQNFVIHRLNVTFWTIYVYERSSSLFTGRPSSFRDDMIDVSYPNDLACPTISEGSAAPKHFQATYNCAWIRSMAQLYKIADRLLVEIYSSNAISTPSDILKVRQATSECDRELQAIPHNLPPYLHFFDQNVPIGEGWQEVQRIMLGTHYYLVRMLLHRPALVFATLFDSELEAENCSSGTMQIHDSIKLSVKSAESLINLAHNVYFHRYPDVKFDATPATFLVSACITLLYEVLEHKFHTDYVRDTFSAVERGIQCLDQLQHIGPTSGKAISLDIMKVAKDAFLSIESNPNEEVDPDSSQFQMPDFQPLRTPSFSQLESILTAPDVNYMSHWLEAGFSPEDIPNCLF